MVMIQAADKRLSLGTLLPNTGIRPRRSGFLAPADRIGRGGDRARQRPCALSRAVPTGRRDESLRPRCLPPGLYRREVEEVDGNLFFSNDDFVCDGLD